MEVKKRFFRFYMEFTIDRVAEIISLTLTPPTVILGFGVLFKWFKPVVTSLKSKTLKAYDFFLLGVFVSFVGSIVDNLYWSIPWSSSFIGTEYTDYLMSIGVYFNIIFRQCSGILAAYFHLKAADLYADKPSRIVNTLLGYSYLSAVALSTTLVIISLLRN